MKLPNMDFFKECICPTLDQVVLSNVDFENEDLEEIDEEELIEDEFVPHNQIWNKITEQFVEERREIEEYRRSKETECQTPLNSAVDFLETHVFPLLYPQILEATINTASSLQCMKHQKTVFNGIDYIAEMLWNLNPKYPERKDNWTFIFDMEWVKQLLNNRPRPYFPLSWIWSKEYAAIKIQAAMRGYWVRSRDDVQEMRQFWKVISQERQKALETGEIPCIDATK